MASGKRKQRGMSIGRVAMIVIVAALSVGIVLIVKNIISLSIEKKALTEKNEELANKRDELSAELENVNDLDYIEEQARKLLHMIKPGEILYILDGSGNPDAGNEGNGIDLPENPGEIPEPGTLNQDEDEDSEEYSDDEEDSEEVESTGEGYSEETYEEDYSEETTEGADNTVEDENYEDGGGEDEGTDG